jgi:hypothetical protein
MLLHESVAGVALLFEACLERGLPLRQPRDVGDRRLLLAASLVACLLHLSQLRSEANAFRLAVSQLAIEVRLSIGQVSSRGRQFCLVTLPLILECSRGVGNLLVQGVARGALFPEPPLEFHLALAQPGGFCGGRLMLTQSLIAGLFRLSQLRDETGALRLGLSAVAVELPLMLSELCGRHRQRRAMLFLFLSQCGSGADNLLLEGFTRGALVLKPSLEIRLAIDEPLDLGDSRLLLVSRPIAGFFHFSQTRGESNAFRVSLCALLLQLRRAFSHLLA